MSLLGSLSQGAYQKSSQFAGDVGDKIKRAYIPETLASMYGAGMFGELLKNIRDTAKTTRKDSEKAQKTIERNYVDTRTLYLDMIKKLESIDRTLKSGQKQNATTLQSAGGDYSTGGNASSPMSPQKGGGDMLSSLLDFAKANPVTTLLGAGGLTALIAKAIAGLTNRTGGGGTGGGVGGDSDYSGPGLRNNPITDLLTDAVTGYAGFKIAKGTIGTAAKGAWGQFTQRRATLSALEEAQKAGMFGMPQTLGAPAPTLTGPTSATSLGTEFESAYAKNRAAGMSPADAKRAAGLEVNGTNFGQLAAKEAAMKPPVAATSAAPTLGEKAASFGSKALQVGGTALKWGGRALGGIGVGLSAYDAYERNEKGDTVGAWLSGGSAALGAAGLAATATGVGAVAGVPLMAGSALLSGVGMARDWLRGPEPEPEKKPNIAATAESGDTAKPIKRVIAAAPGELSVEYEDGSTATRKGVRSVRNNNPGNLEASSWTQTQPGFLGSDGRFAIFKTKKDGEAALQALLKGGKYNQMNLQQAISKYAPESENNTRAYIQSLVNMGLDPNKKIADYTSKEMATLTAGIAKVEGGAGGIMNVALTNNKGLGDTQGGMSDITIADAFGRNAGVLASSELAKLTGFLKEGFENIGNVNYNIDNSIRALGGDPNATLRRTSAPNATRA